MDNLVFEGMRRGYFSKKLSKVKLEEFTCRNWNRLAKEIAYVLVNPVEKRVREQYRIGYALEKDRENLVVYNLKRDYKRVEDLILIDIGILVSDKRWKFLLENEILREYILTELTIIEGAS